MTFVANLDEPCLECGAPLRDHMLGGPAPYHPLPVRGRTIGEACTVLAEKNAIIEQLRKDLAKWKQAASVEADLRREFYDNWQSVLKQLPEGMQHCTIVYEKCEVGHGSLRGTNWLKNECPWCKLLKIREVIGVKR